LPPEIAAENVGKERIGIYRIIMARKGSLLKNQVIGNVLTVTSTISLQEKSALNATSLM